MKSLFGNVRFYVLLFAVGLSLVVHAWVNSILPTETTRLIRLDQVYGLIGLLFLYLAMLAGPLTYTFPWLPLKGIYLKARRALGVSAFYFALLHSLIAFFGQLQGFAGLGFLTERYVKAIAVGFLCLMILFLMAATSFDWVIAKMTFVKWKMLHRLVYLAGILVLMHALMLGSHFVNLSAGIPIAVFVAVGFLLVLEALRLDVFVEKFAGIKTRYHLVLILTGLFLGFTYLRYINPRDGSGAGFNIHTQHAIGQADGAVVVAINTDTKILANQAARLTFVIKDETSQQPITNFSILHDKLLHLIIVDDQLDYFAHLHPDFDGSTFSVTHTFPQDGSYLAYLEFAPSEYANQLKTLPISVGEGKESHKPDHLPDRTLTKTVGDYVVTLDLVEPLDAAKMSKGEQNVVFELTNSSGKEITTIYPYLGAFGHLVMINQKTYDYLHIHPLQTARVDELGGPRVVFSPLALQNQLILPGIYRVFAQFNPDNELIMADFTLEVK